MRVISQAVLALLIVFAPAGGSAQSRDSATFDIYLRGIKAAQLGFTAIEDDGQYSAAAKMQSKGLVGVFTTITYDAKAQGRAVDGDYVPSLYEETRNRDGKIRTARMEYRRGVPLGRELTPARAPRAEDIDPSTQGGTWDVMTAIFAIFRSMPEDEVCGLDQILFDGRRVARIEMSNPQNSGNTITCTADYVRVAGFQDADKAEQTVFPFKLTYEPVGDGDWHVTRMEITTAYGSGRMVRR